MSNAAQGKLPRGTELTNPEEHRAISVFARVEKARSKQRAIPSLGEYIARIELNIEEHEIEVLGQGDRPPKSGHYNLIGEPKVFLARVREIIPA